MQSEFRHKFTHALNQTAFTDYQKEIIVSRYVEAVDDITREYRWSAVMFFILTNVITVGGLVATALTSLLQWTSVTGDARSALTWGVWALTLTISIANIWMQTFSIYKKYVLGTSQRDKLMNEGWSFLAGCGRYTDVPQEKRFGVFCDKVENIITDTTIKLLQAIDAGEQSLQPEDPQKRMNEKSLLLRAHLHPTDLDEVEVIGPAMGHVGPAMEPVHP